MDLTAELKNDLRRRVLAGETLDLETSRAIVNHLRGARFSAAESAKAKPKKSTKKGALSDAELDLDLDIALGLNSGNPRSDGADREVGGTEPGWTRGDAAPDLDIS